MQENDVLEKQKEESAVVEKLVEESAATYENSVTENGVYTRDVYADPKFWNDRFKQ